jgi:sugar/nucleoside kinase (ribokinase family)
LVMPGIDGKPMAELLRHARRAGVITFLDTVWDDTGRWMDILAPCLPYVDYFVPSLLEARVLTGLNDPSEVARALLSRGPGTVGLKMGMDGCLVISGEGQIIRLPAFQVDAVDATGAGDAFAAGFIAGVWEEWSLEQTARFANAVGALSVTGLGAAGGILSLPETLKFMESAIQRSG